LVYPIFRKRSLPPLSRYEFRCIYKYLHIRYRTRTMPHPTDSLIQELCNEALAAKTPEDVERIVSELRSTLEQHIQHARESLKTQSTAISIREKAANNSGGH